MPEMTQRRSNANATNGREKEKENGHLNIRDLKEMNIAALTQVAKDLNVPGYTGMRKQELIFQILKAQTEQSGLIFSEGVLECLPEGFGFLRAPDYNYLRSRNWWGRSGCCPASPPRSAPRPCRPGWRRYSR